MQSHFPIASKIKAAKQALLSWNDFKFHPEESQNYINNAIDQITKLTSVTHLEDEAKEKYIVSAMAGSLISALIFSQYNRSEKKSLDSVDQSKKFYARTKDEVFTPEFMIEYQKNPQDERVRKSFYVGTQILKGELPFDLVKMKSLFSVKLHYHFSIIESHIKNPDNPIPLPTQEEMGEILPSMYITQAFEKAKIALGNNLDTHYKRELLHQVDLLEKQSLTSYSEGSVANHYEYISIATEVELLAMKINSSTLTADHCHEFAEKTKKFRTSSDLAPILKSIVIVTLAIAAGFALGLGISASITGAIIGGIGFFAVVGARQTYLIQKDFEKDPVLQINNISKSMIRVSR
jgi:hypothetical protein